MFDSRRQHACTALTHCNNQFLSWSFYVCFLLHVHSPAVHLVCHLPLHIWLFTVLLKYTKDINFISKIFRNIISNRVKNQFVHIYNHTEKMQSWRMSSCNFSKTNRRFSRTFKNWYSLSQCLFRRNVSGMLIMEDFINLGEEITETIENRLLKTRL